MGQKKKLKNKSEPKNSDKITVKKRGSYVRVYHQGSLRASLNIKMNKISGDTRYFKHLEPYRKW